MAMGTRGTGFVQFFPLFVAFLLFFSAVFVPMGGLLYSQELPAPNASIAEEQDYAFAIGLHRDGLFQIAAEQLEKFARKYPQSIKLQDALFLRADCLFQLEQYAAAVRELTTFVNQYPASNLADNARFRLGDTYLKLRRNRDAIDAYKTILENPKNPSIAGEAAYWIGETYLKDADYTNALKYYTLSYEGFPGNRLQDYAAYSVAWTNQKKGDYAKAAEWYRIVIDKLPQSSLVQSAKVKVGECYYYVKEYARAIEELTGAKAGIDSTELRGEADYLIGESYYNLGQLDKAQKQYESFLKDYPRHRLTNEVQYALGWTLFKERQFASSSDVFGKLASATGEIGEAALYRKGVSEKLAGKREAALETFRKLPQQHPTSEYADNALYDAGTILFEDKKTAEAKSYFEKIVVDFQNSDVIADAYMMLGECCAASAAYDSARAAYEKSLSFGGGTFETKVNSLYQVAWCSFKSRKYKDAVSGFTRFLSSYPAHPKAVEAQYWLAEAEYQGGDFKGALKQYQILAGVAKHPHREEGMYGIGWSYFRLGDFPRAIGAFEQLILAYPSGKFSFDARLRLGDCYFQQKDYKKAAGSYRTVVRLFPKNEGADYAQYQLGQTYYRSGDQDQATDQFTALIKTYPNSSLADDAEYALGWMKFQRKDYLAAIRDFQATIANYPNSELMPRSYYSIGDAYYNLRQYPAAEKSYREVLRKFPKSSYASDALTGIQYCLVAQGKREEAVNEIDSYVKENPSSANAEQLEMKKAELLFSEKQYADAAREYRSFATKYPQSSSRPQAVFWSARSLQEAGNLLEAAKVYQEAADAPQADVNIKGNALLEGARIYLRLKDYEQSFAVLARAETQLSGTEFSPQVAYLQGLVFYENGATDDAKAKFEFVVAKYAASIEADKARIGLTKIALKEKNFNYAQDYAQRVATSRTDEIGAEAQYLSGLAYGEAKDWSNAITAFLRVRYVFPSHEQWLAKAYLGIGQAYEQTNNSAKAKESYQQVLKIYKSGQEFEEASRRLKGLEQQ